MSAEIIQFPIEAARDWVAMERLIRNILLRSAADIELHDAVVEKMKIIFEAIPARFELQVSASELAMAQSLAPHEFAKVVGDWMQRSIQRREEAVLQVHLRLCLELAQAEVLAHARQD